MSKKTTKKPNRNIEDQEAQRIFNLQPGLGDFSGNHWPLWK